MTRSFPLSAEAVLNSNWRPTGKAGTSFGGRRGGGRLHAACDLLAPVGTPISAVGPGKVVSVPLPGHYFYKHVYALEVEHDDGTTVRYGEIQGVADGLKNGARVDGGQTIAYVGKMDHSSMLHFELYSTHSRGPLSIPNRWRRDPNAREPRKPETYSLEEREAILAEGYLWDFQRRADLIDATPLLVALLEGREPDVHESIAPPVVLANAAPVATIHHEPSVDFRHEKTHRHHHHRRHHPAIERRDVRTRFWDFIRCEVLDLFQPQHACRRDPRDVRPRLHWKDQSLPREPSDPWDR